MNQLDMVAAMERRDDGIARAARGAGNEWTRSAARYIAMFAGAVACGEAFLIEDVALRWRNDGREAPKDGRAWGAAARLARQGGYITRVGYGPAKTSNCSPKVLWKRA